MAPARTGAAEERPCATELGLTGCSRLRKSELIALLRDH
ncbi:MULTISPECIES: Rho termination factor N-terminal domain-containing protein [unclassified Microcella]|nr:MULTISPECIES: Rho termination factor N-terminal domain-containing protein [unclassified Microcella]